jgi:hypothetical protein
VSWRKWVITSDHNTSQVTHWVSPLPTGDFALQHNHNCRVGSVHACPQSQNSSCFNILCFTVSFSSSKFIGFICLLLHILFVIYIIKVTWGFVCVFLGLLSPTLTSEKTYHGSPIDSQLTDRVPKKHDICTRGLNQQL